MTVAFSFAITSNMSLYTHHRAGQRDIDAIIEGGGEDDNGNIEREEWDYDVN